MLALSPTPVFHNSPFLMLKITSKYMFSISHILQRIWCCVNVYRFWYGSSSTHRVWRLNLWTTMLLVDFAGDKPICNIYPIKWEGTKKSQSLIKDRHYVLFPRRKVSPTESIRLWIFYILVWFHISKNEDLLFILNIELCLQVPKFFWLFL